MARSGSPLTLTTANGRRPRVAVVGGSPAGTMVAGVLIEQFGCLPVTTRSGETVPALLSRSGLVDLVVIDVPVSGDEANPVSSWIEATGGRGLAPVIALTSEHGPTTVAAYTYLTKPYSPRELHAAMQAALLLPSLEVAGTA